MSDTRHHHATVTWDVHGPSSAMTCTAPPDALCHATYDCQCEEWVDAGVEDGRPWHADHDEADAECRHYGRFNPDECGLRDWYENSDEPLAGTLTFPVTPEWNGDGYTFQTEETTP